MDPVRIRNTRIDYSVASLGVFHVIFHIDLCAGTRTYDVARAVRNMLPRSS